jgi:di/tricarboxylate transporter
VLDVVLLCGILASAVALFATDRLRPDLVAMLVLAALLVAGFFRPTFPTPEEALSGFSNPATVTVGAMFIVSAGLVRTGAVNVISRRIVRLGGHSPTRVVFFLLLTTGLLSAFINNTAALAVFLPISLAISKEYGVNPSRVLIPLSYVVMIGGVCTLIGTSTNLLVSSISAAHGLGEIRMFDLTRMGAVFFGVGLLYIVLGPYRLLPERAATSGLTPKYQLANYLSGLIVKDKSPLVGKTPAESRLSERYDVTILQIMRGNENRWFGLRDTPLQAGDRLLVRGDANDILRMKEAGLVPIGEVKFAEKDLSSEQTALAEAILPPTSSLIGTTLKEVDFRHKYGVFALAIRKHGRTIHRKLADIRLDVGDSLLLQGRRSSMDGLFEDPDFLGLRELDIPPERERRSLLAVSIAVLVVGLAAAGVMPILASSVLGCLLMITSGCLTVKEAYESVDWMVIFLLVGLIPLGMAMEKTGTARFFVSGVLRLTESLGPAGAVSCFYLITAALTNVMSNNAAAILLAPIGIASARELGVNPWPFLMAILFGASAAFATPVGYQTNLMVFGPGAYRYRDFLRAGIPMTVIFWALATVLIPVLWPLRPPGASP